MHLRGFLQKSSRLFINHREEDKVLHQIPYSLFLYHVCISVEEIKKLHQSSLGSKVHLLKFLKGRSTDTWYMSKTLCERKNVVSPSNWPQTSQLTLKLCRRTNSSSDESYLVDFRASCSFNRPGLKLKTIPPLFFLFPALMTELFP